MSFPYEVSYENVHSAYNYVSSQNRGSSGQNEKVEIGYPA